MHFVCAFVCGIVRQRIYYEQCKCMRPASACGHHMCDNDRVYVAHVDRACCARTATTENQSVIMMRSSGLRFVMKASRRVAMVDARVRVFVVLYRFFLFFVFFYVPFICTAVAAVHRCILI